MTKFEFKHELETTYEIFNKKIEAINGKITRNGLNLWSSLSMVKGEWDTWSKSNEEKGWKMMLKEAGD